MIHIDKLWEEKKIIKKVLRKVQPKLQNHQKNNILFIITRYIYISLERIINKIAPNSPIILHKNKLVLENKVNKFHIFLLLQVKEIQEFNNNQMKMKKLKSLI